jgi:hypothetical protein
MEVTKQQVLDRAKELGLNLTDTQIEQLVKDGKLPEKQTPEERKEELKSKYNVEQLIDMLLDARTDAKQRRHEAKELKDQLEGLKVEMQGISDFKTKYPELEKKLNTLSESEKKRREQILAKLDKAKAERLTYLQDVDRISADQFDSTVELLGSTKSNGAEAPAPGGGDPPKVTLTPDQKREADRMGLSEAEFAEVNAKRKTK